MPNEASKNQYHYLDKLVDERLYIKSLIDSGLYDDSPDLKKNAYKQLDSYTEDIFECLNPYLTKYCLLLTGRLKQSAWTKDTYTFLSLLVSSSSKVHDFEYALSHAQYVLRDYLTPDVEDSTLPDKREDSQLQYPPIFAYFVEMTIEILNSYVPKYKVQTGERINFIHVYMVQFRYKLNSFIASLSKDIMVKNLKYDFDYLESDDSLDIDDIDAVDISRRFFTDHFFETYEEFLAADYKPWSLLSQMQKDILWQRYICLNTTETIIDDFGITPSIYRNNLSEIKTIVLHSFKHILSITDRSLITYYQ